MKILFYTIATAVVLSSCGARQKTVEETSEKSENKTVVDSSGTSETKSQNKNILQDNSVECLNEESLDVEVADGDSLSVKKYGHDGKLISETVYTGSGKAKSKKTAKRTENKIIEVHSSEKEVKVAVAVKKKTEAKSAVKQRTMNLNREAVTVFDFWWLWILIAAVLLYLNYRFKILGFLKKHVLNLFRSQNTLAKNQDNEG